MYKCSIKKCGERKQERTLVIVHNHIGMQERAVRKPSLVLTEDGILAPEIWLAGVRLGEGKLAEAGVMWMRSWEGKPGLGT